MEIFVFYTLHVEICRKKYFKYVWLKVLSKFYTLSALDIPGLFFDSDAIYHQFPFMKAFSHFHDFY